MAEFNVVPDSWRILLLEDSPEDAELVERELRKARRNFVIHRVESRDAFQRELAEFNPDVVVCDYHLPAFDGHSALLTAKQFTPDLPVLMVTGPVNEEAAVACLKDGADDYILKDQLARLSPAIGAAVEAGKARARHREAQARLEESEERFRQLVETACDAIVSFDSEGDINFWNPAAEATFGPPSGDVLGQPIWAFLEDGGESALRRRVEELASERSNGSPSDPFPLVGKGKTGARFPMEISLSSWCAREQVHFNAIIRDTSERDSAREALESLSTQHELLLQSAGEGIVGLDSDGSVTFVNPKALELLGRESEELLGRSFHALAHQTEAQLSLDPPSECLVQSSLQEGNPFRGESRFHRKDGTPFTVSVNSTPTRDQKGAVLIFQDVTEQKKAESAIRASEAQYRGLFEQAPYGIYLSTPTGRFLSVNPALVEMLGYDSEQDLLRGDLKELYLTPQDRTEALDQAGRHERIIGFETTWRKKDKSHVTVSLSGRRVLDQKGRLEGFEVLVEDLTERKALESQLRQAQKMEAVGQLTGGIAHDFNNVLAVVLLNAELMMAAMESGEAVEPGDVVSIRDAAKRASSITKKLLSFSRRAELTLEPVSLDAVVRDIAPMLRRLLPENVELEIEAGPGSGTSVMADPGAMEQIILNLCTNSRDAMPRGGRLSIRVAAKSLNEESCLGYPGLAPGHWVHVSISDTGVGMDARTLEKIFEPFFTTKEVGQGTGLGMAMVYGLTQQQGGAVKVTSVPGEGTATDLFLPVREVEVVALKEEREVHASQPGSGTVLVVEDDPNLRETTASALRRNGFDVLLACDGKEGLDLYTEHHGTIDLVLSDHGLPKLNGLELLERLNERFGPVRFILVSGYPGDHTGPRPPLPPGARIFKKPWSLSDLLSTVHDTLENSLTAAQPSAGRPSSEPLLDLE